MAAGALDMALDDVIKSKGGTRGGGGKANAKAGRNGSKPQQQQRKVVRNVKAKVTADVPKSAADGDASGARKSMLGRLPRFAKGLAATLNKAAKASAASAREGTDGAGAGGRPRAVPEGPRALSAKLGMSLDDLSKGDAKKKQAQKGRVAGGGGAKEGSPAAGQVGKRVAAGGRRTQQQQRSKLRQDQTLVASKTKPTAKAKAMGGVRMGRFAQRQQQVFQREGRWGSQLGQPTRLGGGMKGGGMKGGKGKVKGGKSWFDPWASSPRREDAIWGHSGADPRGGTWKGGKGGMASADRWAPPQRGPAGRQAGTKGGGAWGRGAPTEDFSGPRGGQRWGPLAQSGKGGKGGKGGGWGGWDDRDGRGGVDESRDGWGGGAGNSSRNAALREWDRQPAPKESRANMHPGAMPRNGGSDGRNCRIKVTNVPSNLNRRDVKEAFEDSGTVVQCIVERGTSWVTFANAMDAKKAMYTFDRGQLNGNTIYVTLD